MLFTVMLEHGFMSLPLKKNAHLVQFNELERNESYEQMLLLPSQVK